MDEKKLQKRYAQSLFDLAKENNSIPTIYKDITYIHTVCKENRELEVVLKNPTIMPLKKRQILLALFEKSCDSLTTKFLSLVASKRREIYLKGICEEFIDIFNKYNNIKIATITVANDIDENIKNTIKNTLERELNCTIELDIHKDANLIGGFVINVDSEQYDASFLRRLNDLKRNITK
jgi:F-type H+-transporting ATPase subunit delta